MWKYNIFEKDALLEDIWTRGVARFKIGDNLYSLYKNNAINYDLVQDNSEKMQKLTKHTNLDELLILLENMNEEELKNDK